MRARAVTPGAAFAIPGLTPGRLWLALFAFWLVFLSGVIGSPGILQLLRLESLLAAKNTQAEKIQDDIQRLETESALLEKSKMVQQREIRRVLGYAAPDELIFDFTVGTGPLNRR